MSRTDAGQRASADSMLGQEVGIWRISRLLGRGGMGRVYEAVQPSTGGRVAVKIMAPEVSENPDAIKRFFAEARAVNLIRHEHIVDVLAMATLADGRPYIVMEHLAGAPLRGLIRTGPLPLGSLAELIGEALDALGAAHARGVVHRDLKPDNIFVSPGGHAKLLDFGLVKLAPEIGADMPETRTGVVMGTPPYMAPEYIAGGEADPRSDLYAMGVILFEAATGRLPFSAASGRDLFRQHMEDPPPAPRGLRAEIPGEYETVILRALCKAPVARFPDAAAMAAALRGAARGLPDAAWAPLIVPEPTPATDVTQEQGAGDPAQVATADAVGGRSPVPRDTLPTRDVVTPAAPKGSLAPGTRLGDRYRIEELLGSGGMGRVYRAADLTLDREVALKTLRIESDRGMERLRREVKLASRITHPNVIRLYDLDTDGPTSFVTMELIRGASLRTRIAAGRVDEAECVRVARACALGLGAAHATGVVHRDFKPENVLIDAGDRVVVVDFGVAGEQSDDASAASAIVGTSGYMAPEQANGQPPTPAADLYALGLVMFEMLTGEVPLLGRGPVDTAVKRSSEPVPSVRAQRPEISERVDRLIQTLLAHRPAARPASAEAVVAALAEADQAAATAPPARWRWLVAAAALLAVAGVGVVWWTRRGEPEPRQAVPAPAPIAEPAAEAAAQPAEPPPQPSPASREREPEPMPIEPKTPPRPDVKPKPTPVTKPEPTTRPPPKPQPPPASQGDFLERLERDDRSWSQVDPLAAVADVRAVARRLAPDAQLVDVDASCVGPDGTVTFGRCGGDARVKYVFTSPANAERRPEHIGLIGPDGTPEYGKAYVCVIEAMADARGIRASWRTSEVACHRNKLTPRCSMAQLRKRITEVPPTSGTADPDTATLDAHWINLRVGRMWNIYVRKGSNAATWRLPDDC